MYVYVIIVASLVLLVGSVGFTFAQNTDNANQDPAVGNMTTTTISNSTIVESKFEHGFYQKIQGLMAGNLTRSDSDATLNNATRYYSTIILTARDNVTETTEDSSTNSYKDFIVEKLKLVGARDITPAQSLSFVTASIPLEKIPRFSSHEEVYFMGDGELPIKAAIDMARETIHATDADISAIDDGLDFDIDGSGRTIAVIDEGIRQELAFGNRLTMAL